jgi:hypothetical protein
MLVNHYDPRLIPIASAGSAMHRCVWSQWFFFGQTSDKGTTVKLFIPEEVSELLRVKLKTVYYVPWRQKIGLPAVKLNRRLLFREADIIRVLDEHTEQLPMRPSKEDKQNDSAAD